jgi:endonuclease/exonuclease/phosphatase family metal-dependent hydrolase
VLNSVLKVATLNAHQFHGPVLNGRQSIPRQLFYLLGRKALVTMYKERVKEFASTSEFDVIAFQEVFQRFGIPKMHERYKVFEGTGFETIIVHGLGASFYTYENVLLSKLPLADGVKIKDINYPLPHRMYWTVRVGFTVAPFIFADRVILVCNVHLHAGSVSKRENQVIKIIRVLAEVIENYGGDVPVLLLGDLNTVPEGAQTSGFPTGDDDNYEGDNTLKFFAKIGLKSFIEKDEPSLYTYPAAVDIMQTDPRCRTLDYILYSRHWEPIEYKVLHSYFLSDHYPVVGTFRLR